MANSYRKLVYDIKELKHLRYLDTGEKFDQRDKIRATAARVGLNVPRVSISFVASSPLTLFGDSFLMKTKTLF
jgi:hypothetical protein